MGRVNAIDVSDNVIKKFIKSIRGADNLIGVFENEGETGYLYCYSPAERKIYMNIIIYDYKIVEVEPLENDVQLAYQKNSNLCGVYVWGKLRGYINFSDKSRNWIRFCSPDNPGISDTGLPEKYVDFIGGINNVEIDKDAFIEDRMNYWKDLARRLDNSN